MEDAEVALVLIGSTAGTAKVAVDQLREQGVKAGLSQDPGVPPLPRPGAGPGPAACEGPGHHGQGGEFLRQRRPPLLRGPGRLVRLGTSRPRTVGYVYGLGGRDITPAHFHTVFARLQAIAAGGELGPVYTHLGQRG